MENFKTLLRQEKTTEITNFMKNSKIDLLKSIAKRFKISITGKKKSELISEIENAIASKKSFSDEPNIAQMSVAQLKNKAIELNIDVSNLKLKQALKMAILDKMSKPSASSTETPTIASTMDNYGMLKSKSIPYLKTLAKQLKIKISKLSKEQLITSILEKTSSQGILPILQEGEKDFSKLTKNELLIKANELGFVPSKSEKITKETLIKYLTNKNPTIQDTETPKKKTKDLSFPLNETDLSKLKTQLKVGEIKEILIANNIKIPSGSKKDDLLKLLLLIQPVSKPIPTELPITTVEDVDIVALEDIESPFTPANINDLTEEPSEQNLNDEIMRCLKFYEYPI